MEKQHLTYFRVENFKKFDSLEVENIGQFNLIVGDNNVGKTCLLEALLFDRDEKKISYNLNQILKLRGLIRDEKDEKRLIELYEDRSNNIYRRRLAKDVERGILYYYKFLENDRKLKLKLSNIDSFNFSIFDEEVNDIIEISFKQVDELNNSGNLKNINIPFISFNLIFSEDIVEMYNSLKTKSDKQLLIQALQTIECGVIDIELRQDFEDLDFVFLISLDNKEEFVPINYFGDGFRRLFYIVLKILSLKGRRIMIDEIDSGVHYSKQKDFLKNIIEICKMLDIQLFATTHSEECIRKVVNASRELNLQNLVRLIKLKEMKDGQVKAITYPFKEYEYLVQSETEVR